ncbi:MAG: hypothetical protein Q8941_22750 [Bacteroidota bacterium]|nr:hypothetical protein [Bacteroidota bacterium]
MKLLSTLVFLTVFTFSAFSQQWKFIGGYSLGIPQKDMHKNIPPAHSLQAGIVYQLPGQWKQLSVGAETGIGLYASKRVDQTFQFENNTSSIVPVNYNSNVFNADLQARLDLVDNKKFVIPYIGLKGGLYNFFSTIRIEDPNDPGGCTALQHKNILSDNTFYWSAGAGLQVNTSFFAKRKFTRNVLIDISANMIHGGSISYINTKHLIDEQTMNDPKAQPLNVQFINASTQQIHEHTVAQVFTSPLRMIELRAGVVVLLRRD